jgi:glucosamine--fructose-6-phosphate aminotransferase (isomerizing)
MCGIVGYIGKNSCKKILIDGLKKIQNRGYDSVGISLLKNNKINTYKFASTHTNDSLSLLEEHVLNNNIDSCVGIGHTRWATHGRKSDLNAHPHTDNLNRISIVHNGIIENYLELKNNLIKDGYSFKTETDTEVIAVLISKYLDKENSIDVSIQKCISELRGSWALCIMFNENPKSMWLTRNGSPLLLGIESDYAMVFSENSGFNNQIKKYIVIDNNDIIKVTYDNNKLEYSCDIKRYKTNNHIAIADNNLPDKYDHWMLKEIMEQPLCINRALNNGGRISGNTTVKLGGLETFKNQLEHVEHLILLGCGTSYHAGIWSLNQFKQYDIFNTVSCFDGAEFNILDIPKKGKTAVILLSQSGETKDLHRCIDIAKTYDLITIGVVNVHDSMIARETDCGVYLNAGRENAVASTKSFTNQCIVLSMIAIWFSQVKGTYINKRQQVLKDLMKLEFNTKTTIENVEKQIKCIVENISLGSLFVLGKGECEAIAKEGALKIKEVSYLHAEGYSSSALKHGPFALIQQKTPIIIIDICKKYHEKNLNACNETLSRGSLNIIITNDNTLYANHNIPEENIITIENNETYNSLIANVCIQLISYYLSIKFNYNPDFPRNLAKVVTVE